MGGKVIVTGIFKAKSHQWGQERADRRSELYLESIALLDLEVANEGREPTLMRTRAHTGIVGGHEKQLDGGWAQRKV